MEWVKVNQLHSKRVLEKKLGELSLKQRRSEEQHDRRIKSLGLDLTKLHRSTRDLDDFWDEATPRFYQRRGSLPALSERLPPKLPTPASPPKEDVIKSARSRRRLSVAAIPVSPWEIQQQQQQQQQPTSLALRLFPERSFSEEHSRSPRRIRWSSSFCLGDKSESHYFTQIPAVAAPPKRQSISLSIPSPISSTSSLSTLSAKPSLKHSVSDQALCQKPYQNNPETSSFKTILDLVREETLSSLPLTFDTYSTGSQSSLAEEPTSSPSADDTTGKQTLINQTEGKRSIQRDFPPKRQALLPRRRSSDNIFTMETATRKTTNGVAFKNSEPKATLHPDKDKESYLNQRRLSGTMTVIHQDDGKLISISDNGECAAEEEYSSDEDETHSMFEDFHRKHRRSSEPAVGGHFLQQLQEKATSLEHHSENAELKESIQKNLPTNLVQEEEEDADLPANTTVADKNIEETQENTTNGAKKESSSNLSEGQEVTITNKSQPSKNANSSTKADQKQSKFNARRDRRKSDGDVLIKFNKVWRLQPEVRSSSGKNRSGKSSDEAEMTKANEEKDKIWKAVRKCRYIRGYDPPELNPPDDLAEFVFGHRDPHSLPVEQ